MKEHTYVRTSDSCEAQLLAIIEILEHDCEPGDVIYTDSDYLLSNIQSNRIGNWIANGWMTKANKPVANKELWLKIIDLSASLGVMFRNTNPFDDPYGNITYSKVVFKLDGYRPDVIGMVKTALKVSTLVQLNVDVKDWNGLNSEIEITRTTGDGLIREKSHDSDVIYSLILAMRGMHANGEILKYPSNGDEPEGIII